MASNIISSTIDGTFPVAGQDNDSQGFRDNFSIIKDNFAYAKTEIEDLQDNTAKLNVDNAYNDNTQSSLNLLAHTETLYDATGGISSNTSVDFSTGHHFAISCEADLTLTLTGWPTTSQYAEMRLQLFSKNSGTHAITIASEYASAASSNLYTDGDAEWSTATVTLDAATTTSKVIKAWTYDGGENVFLEFVGTYVGV